MFFTLFRNINHTVDSYIHGIYMLSTWCTSLGLVTQILAARHMVTIGVSTIWKNTMTLEVDIYFATNICVTSSCEIHMTHTLKYTRHIHWNIHDIYTEIYMTYTLKYTWHIHWNIHDICTEIYMAYTLKYTWHIHWNIHEIYTEIYMTHTSWLLTLPADGLAMVLVSLDYSINVTAYYSATITSVNRQVCRWKFAAR